MLTADLPVKITDSGRQTASVFHPHITETNGMMFVSWQWWPLVVCDVWGIVGVPPVGMLITAVLIANFGGVYNCIAYTVIRRRLQQQNLTGGQQVIFSGGGGGSRPSAFNSSGTDSGDSVVSMSSATSVTG